MRPSSCSHLAILRQPTKTEALARLAGEACGAPAGCTPPAECLSRANAYSEELTVSKRSTCVHPLWGSMVPRPSWPCKPCRPLGWTLDGRRPAHPIIWCPSGQQPLGRSLVHSGQRASGYIPLVHSVSALSNTSTLHPRSSLITISRHVILNPASRHPYTDDDPRLLVRL